MTLPTTSLLSPSLVTTYLFLCLLSAGGMLVVAADLWRSRSTTAGWLALAVIGCVLGWLLTVILSLLSPTAALALFWHGTVRWVFIVLLPPLVILYIACYFGVPRFSPRLVVSVGAIPGLTVLLALTNGLHHWFLTTYGMQRAGPYFVRSDWAVGPWFPIYVVFVSASLLVVVVALVHSYRGRASLYRAQVWVFVAALLLPVAFFTFDTYSRSPLALLGLSPLGFAMMALLLTWGLHQERILDLVPVARNAIFAGMADPVIVLDGRGRIVDLNAAAEEALGCAVDRAVGADIDTLLPQRLAELQATESGNGREGAWMSLDLAHDGQTRFYDVRLSSFGLRAGRIDGRILVLRDVTALKQVEQRLAEQASQLEAIFEAITDGIAVYDPQGRFVRANRAMEQMYGFAADSEFTSLPLTTRAQRLQIYDEHGQRLPAEQWPHWRVLHGEDLTGPHALDTRAVTLDGRQIWVSTTAAPIRGHDGTTAGVVLVNRDVTARRQLEQDMMHQAREVTAVFDAVAEGITIYDAQGRITKYNRAFLDLMGIDVGTEYLSCSYPRRVATLHPRSRDGQPVAYEQMLLTRALRGNVIPADEASDTIVTTLDGREITLSRSAVPIRDAQGQIVGATIVHRDVTHHRQLERQVQEQADQLASIFEATADGVGVFDGQRRLMRANRAWRAILEQYVDVTGLSADPAFAALPLADQVDRLVLYDEHGHVIPREERPTARALRGETMTGASAVDEWMHNPAGEAVVMLSVSAAPIRSATGQITGVVTIVRDVTARRQIERQLAEQEGQFRTLVENMPDYVTRHDPLLRMLYANPRAEAAMGIPLAARKGKTFADLGLPAALYAPWECAIREVFATGEPYEFDATSPFGNGTTGAQTYHYRMRYIPEFAEDRAVASVLGIASDVTALRQTEARLAEQASQLEAIFEAQMDGVAVYDLHGRIVRTNTALRQLLGLDADPEFTTHPLAERAERLWLFEEQGQLLTAEQWPFCRVLRGETLAGASAMDLQVQTLDGREIWASITGAPMRAPDGQVTGGVVVTRDVTARRELERRLQAHIAQAATEAERARLARELHDTVTQDLYSATLMAEALPRLWTQHPADAERALGQLHEITQSGLATMRVLLLELRPDGLEEMTLPILLQLLLNAMRARAGVPLSLEVAGDEESWPSLPQEVKQAFYRIAQEAVTNAVKYASASRIVVRLRRGQRGSLHMEVEDDGVGFDPHTSAPGHFGLKMTRERAQAVGATVRMESRVGQGTRVVIHRKGTEKGQEETAAARVRQSSQEEKGAARAEAH